MASDWRFVDVDLLLRCLPFMATRDVGRVLSTCDAWRGCGEKKEVWSVLLVRHGWRRRPAASEEEEASDGDVAETTASVRAFARGPRGFSLKESNGAEESSESESEDDDEARARRFRRRFVARWRRWLPFARGFVVGLDCFLFAARPFCRRHGITALRARRRLRDVAAADHAPRPLARYPEDRSDDVVDDEAAAAPPPSRGPEEAAATWDEVAVDDLMQAIEGLVVVDDDPVPVEAPEAPRGVRIETTSTPLPARASRLRRVRLTATVAAPPALVRAALRDLGARRDAWECGLTEATSDPLVEQRPGSSLKRSTALHRRADVVRLDYGEAHVRLARLVERGDDAADGTRFGGPGAACVILEHGPVVGPLLATLGGGGSSHVDAGRDSPRFAPRTVHTADLETNLGIVSVEASGFLVAPAKAATTRTEVCYVVQERVSTDPNDDPTRRRGYSSGARRGACGQRP